MSILSDLLAGGASQLVDSVGNTLDKVITTKGEKMQLDNEMQKAEQDYQIQLKTLSVTEQKQVFDDINSARQRDSTVQTSANATKFSKNVSPILALGTTLFAFILFFILIFYKDQLTEEKVNIILYILGVLSAIVTQIFSFYFGSSMGSSDKSEYIHRFQNKQQAGNQGS
jgi:hypothetical protein